ncbi:glycosyltransferase family 2 protein [Nocardioides iriomotensis]|uniref:Glycosyltransferase family 2 protein n=1 Tax=Nocardioides iriomotensis TaxID=715784 RepID=A0A4Q5IXJ8_9ACTN|nr:glycosyltransferase family 2 protein [Nocardioides iriomotensis]RYU09649.1 glycosyltransferase family 2 protein [Nocardioides iriomotensis]
MHAGGTWEVPAYDTVRWRGRTRRDCVVIPVINEGPRIRSLLTKMRAIDVPSLADIIIVDGGSTDGSLPTDLLDDADVAALLVKTGPGKLSAQLRCAYAFVLEQGYEGIVTIDGNDKDDPTPIPNFLEALQSGVDFVQASRFVEGGVAVNTPLSRDLAIRLLHAPALSLASRHRWTDTTQGFRGYRSEVLRDLRVAPFREVFQAYELLAYLTYRVPRLGYRCLELPTSRVYPDGEVPTKISGLRGNAELIKVLLSACLGRYNP